MEKKDSGQHGTLRCGSIGGVPNNCSDDDDGYDGGESEWEAFDAAAFRGKTAVPTPLAVEGATPGQATMVRPSPKGSQSAVGVSGRVQLAPSMHILPAQITPRRFDDDVDEEEGRLLESVRLMVSQSEEATGCPAFSRGRKSLPPTFSGTTPYRWEDYCNARSNTSSIDTTSSSSSAEEKHLFMPARADPHGRSLSPARLAPGYDGGGDCISALFGKASGAFTENDDNKYHYHHHRHQPEPIPQQQARRLPLSVYNNTSAQRNVGGSTYAASTARAFAWSVLLHGCLCEAPLAVVEGVARGCLYLVIAAWVAVAAFIGASGHAAYRAELLRHAAALAREGCLFFAASLSLAVPFSTIFTVYDGVVDRAEDETWDVRPVPTVLGAVDPRRFCVFAFGQVGELAANGRPEPLQQPIFADDSLRTGLGGLAAEELREVNNNNSRSRSSSTLHAGVIAAQSMDTDRLGVGILHPPHELELRFRRARATGRGAALSAYRRLANSAVTAYRRLQNFVTIMARNGT